MTKYITLIGVLLTTLVLPAYDANAGLFDWVDQGESNYLSSSGAFGRIYENFKSFQLTKEELKQDEEVEKTVAQEASKSVAKNNSAEPKNQTKQIMVVVATAYSSTPDQTDETPFVTAWNTNVRDGIIAANFLPFGTQIKIPEIFGDKVFVVEDRMHKRFWYRIDVWFPERQMAKEFGVKKVRIEIVS